MPALEAEGPPLQQPQPQRCCCSRGTKSPSTAQLHQQQDAIGKTGHVANGKPATNTTATATGKKGAHQQDLLSKCLAVQLKKTEEADEQWMRTSTAATTTRQRPPKGDNEDAEEEWWKYQNGFVVYQSFIGSNIGCWWNCPLQAALRGATYAGWASPGILLLSGTPRLLEPFRTAWTRRTLRPPKGFDISAMGDVEECCIKTVPQGQFTPLPDAICWAIHDLQNPSLEQILASLNTHFPDNTRPSKDLVYVTLGRLIRENKVFQSKDGSYAIVNPRNFTSDDEFPYFPSSQSTEYDGDFRNFTCQVSFADILKGELEGDIVCWTRRRPTSSMDGGLNLIRRSSTMSRLHRQLSLRRRPRTESPSVERRPHQNDLSYLTLDVTIAEPKRPGLLERLFSSRPHVKIVEFSAQFPPPEWDDPRLRIRHCVGTQTSHTHAVNDGRDSLDYRGRSLMSHHQPFQRSRSLPSRASRPLPRPPSKVVYPARAREPIVRIVKIDRNINDTPVKTKCPTIKENIPLGEPVMAMNGMPRRYKKVTIEKFEETTITEENVISGYVPPFSRITKTTTTTTTTGKVNKATSMQNIDKAEHLAVNRTSSAPGKGAIYVNPMAETALLKEERQQQMSPPSTISEGYGSRASTPSKASEVTTTLLTDDSKLKKLLNRRKDDCTNRINNNNKVEDLSKAIRRKSYLESAMIAAGAIPGNGLGITREPLPPEIPEHHYLSLSDLTVNFKSVVGQKLLQGCSANSIDTLTELDIAARMNNGVSNGSN